jgi:hypothetical protein
VVSRWRPEPGIKMMLNEDEHLVLGGSAGRPWRLLR